MSRRQKHPLRTLKKDERLWLKRIARSTSEPASHVARAKQVLAVADGLSYSAAAHAAGRKSGDAVAMSKVGLGHKMVDKHHGIDPTSGTRFDFCGKAISSHYFNAF